MPQVQRSCTHLHQPVSGQQPASPIWPHGAWESSSHLWWTPAHQRHAATASQPGLASPCLPPSAALQADEQGKEQQLSRARSTVEQGRQLRAVRQACRMKTALHNGSWNAALPAGSAWCPAPVLPRSSAALMSAPASSSRRTTSSCPYLAAMPSGVCKPARGVRGRPALGSAYPALKLYCLTSPAQRQIPKWT